MNKLPIEEALEIADFAEYISKKYEDELIQKGIERIITAGDTLKFLHDEEAIFSLTDIKEEPLNV